MSKIETTLTNRTTLLLLMIAVITAAIATIPGTAFLLPVQAADVDGDEDQNDDNGNGNDDDNSQNGIDEGDQG